MYSFALVNTVVISLTSNYKVLDKVERSFETIIYMLDTEQSQYFAKPCPVLSYTSGTLSAILLTRPWLQ